MAPSVRPLWLRLPKVQSVSADAQRRNETCRKGRGQKGGMVRVAVEDKGGLPPHPSKKEKTKTGREREIKLARSRRTDQRSHSLFSGLDGKTQT
mmetsp:Transcript_39548/g.77850  ORF Transcript_39548/g.77850 Transcript_39548/m.77850 type:complete len:94 (+) Transcript_39548:175-456(+)